MTEAESGLFASSPEAVFYILANDEAGGDFATEKLESLDGQSGVQASLDLNQLGDSQVFDEVLKSAKLGSRWGKDLSNVYRDYLQAQIEQVDENNLSDEIEAQFSRYDADPYESGVLSEPMTIGIDLTAQIQKQLDQWEQIQFTRDDLAAATGIAARTEKIADQNTYGAIIFQSEEPLSQLKQRQPFVRASQNLQQFLLMGLDVALIAPVGEHDEVERAETTFRGVGSFSVESVAGVQFDVSEDIATVVEEWYDRLRYEVADNRVVENVVRPASVTAFDLPDEPWSRHFKNAITLGLQGAYSEKSFNENRFNELWDEHISSHPNYDQYRSRRSTFPEVKVTRKADEISNEFSLHHKGPSAKPFVCDLPAQSSNPEEELVNRLKRFLDADPVSEQRWSDLLGHFKEISQTLETTPESLAENALLSRHRQRGALSPLIPPADKTGPTRALESRDGDYDDVWYDDHWSTILSDFAITKQAGVGAIERKRDLQQQLNPNREGDEALYYKLECDIENAWRHYVDSLTDELRQSLTDTQNLSIEHRETNSAYEVDITVDPDGGQKRTVMIEISLPYSEVFVDGTKVPAATVTNTVSEVIDELGTAIQSRSETLSLEESADLLYDLTRTYLEVAEFEQGELVYFDDVIEFCLSLPNVREMFETPEQNVEDEIRGLLGSKRYMSRLHESAVTFHRKGSDRHGSVKVQGDRYIAMELQEPLE